MSYDMVIRNGTVIDGTGMASFRADVGIAHGRIAKIDRIKERGREEIDADGHIVSFEVLDVGEVVPDFNTVSWEVVWYSPTASAA